MPLLLVVPHLRSPVELEAIIKQLQDPSTPFETSFEGGLLENPRFRENPTGEGDGSDVLFGGRWNRRRKIEG